ncbi:hypothetical protein F5Y16DRAFT_399667 [Xylariaceae sp. FL0255]|nr:hypothetical protein F5Y16DRAFT_399667 [Xylariaceae sp. FL0255]
MSFALTYGSFGDLITTIQLVYRLSQALSEIHGSARQLQDLVVELRLFRDVLEQVKIGWQRKKPCPELNTLAPLIEPVIVESREDIETFLEKMLKRYGKQFLQPRSSRRTFGDVVKVIQWEMCETEKVEKLRKKLSRRQIVIHTALQEAHKITEEQDHAVLRESIASLIAAEKAADAKIADRFTQLTNELEKGAMTLSRIEKSVTSTKEGIYAIQRAVRNIEQEIFTLPGRINSFTGNIAYIEDALGWTLPVLLDYCPSWETIHSIIKDHFVHRAYRGMDLVESRRYVLQDRKTRQDASQHIPFNQVACPGQRFDMAMIFHTNDNDRGAKSQKDGAHESICPGCGHVNMVDDPALDVVCQNSQCDKIYRRIIDVSDFDEERLHQFVTFGEPTDEAEDDHNDEDGLQSLCTSKKGIQDYIDGPEIFKRVRLLTRWEDRLEYRGDRTLFIDGISFWEMTSHDVVRQMGLAILVRILASTNSVWSGFEELPEFDSGLLYNFLFAGCTRTQSVPIILVTANLGKIRRRAAKMIRTLDWVQNGSRISVVTLPRSAVYTGEAWARLFRQLPVRVKRMRAVAVRMLNEKGIKI